MMCVTFLGVNKQTKVLLAFSRIRSYITAEKKRKKFKCKVYKNALKRSEMLNKVQIGPR